MLKVCQPNNVSARQIHLSLIYQPPPCFFIAMQESTYLTVHPLVRSSTECRLPVPRVDGRTRWIFIKIYRRSRSTRTNDRIGMFAWCIPVGEWNTKIYRTDTEFPCTAHSFRRRRGSREPGEAEDDPKGRTNMREGVAQRARNAARGNCQGSSSLIKGYSLYALETLEPRSLFPFTKNRSRFFRISVQRTLSLSDACVSLVRASRMWISRLYSYIHMKLMCKR